MRIRGLALAACLWVIAASGPVITQSEPTPLGAPAFHHVHLNSTNPSAAIDGYLKLFTGTTRVKVAGFEGVKSGDAYVLLTKVKTPPPTQPQSAWWHEVWETPDVRQFITRMRSLKMEVLPLYTSDEGESVEVSSDALGFALTKAGLEDAKRRGVQPSRRGGLIYGRGPDGVLLEVTTAAGPTDRLSMIDLWEEYPICAELWYRTHLNASGSPFAGRRGGPPPRAVTEAECKVPRGEPSWPSPDRQGTFRVPDGWAGFNGIFFHWYSPATEGPLVSTRGQFGDHVALSVSNLDRWIAKLTSEQVKFLEKPYKFGDTRAVMIEGPSREAIEIVEIK